jgi:Ca-activated chloride channel family protein
VPLKRTELFGEVAGPLASLRLVQTFGYERAQSDKVLEAAYRFPLPGDAAVTRVLVRFGAVEIRAELKERQQAEAQYEEAKRQGRQAALATRESPDVFTLQVAGLRPDEDITVETSYVQLARAEGRTGPCACR